VTTLAEPAPAAPSITPFTRPRSHRADRRRWQDGPTPASLADLVALTREVAAEVDAGRHAVEVDPVHRWSTRLHADDHLDVWLISWATDQAAELHDHGGSLGALTVVRGGLTEWRWTPGRDDDGDCVAEELPSRGPGLRRRVVDAGRSIAFGLGHVHDVANRARETAVSVHAYSPPLSAMSYYSVGGGVLRRTRSELVAPGESPE
jgi:predicted metal-dependent enzyme (double-stranded beta helix superfamily)